VPARGSATTTAATVATLEAQQAGLQVTATALAEAAAGSSLNPLPAQFLVDTDLDAFAAGDAAARADAAADLRAQLAPYPVPDCRAGFVLVSGYAGSFDEGVRLSNAFESFLFQEFPETFVTGATGSQSFGDTSGEYPAGQVLLEVFFFDSCNPYR
jgi:hypothetical protein